MEVNSILLVKLELVLDSTFWLIPRIHHNKLAEDYKLILMKNHLQDLKLKKILNQL